MEQKKVETVSPGGSDEGKKGESIDLSKEKIDSQKSFEAIGDKRQASENSDKNAARNRIDGIGDGGDDGNAGKPDDFSEQSFEPKEKMNEAKETAPEYKEAQQQIKNEAQERLDNIADK